MLHRLKKLVRDLSEDSEKLDSSPSFERLTQKSAKIRYRKASLKDRYANTMVHDDYAYRLKTDSVQPVPKAIKSSPELPDPRYINASYILGFMDRSYIAAQAPICKSLEPVPLQDQVDTIIDFLQMIYESAQLHSNFAVVGLGKNFPCFWRSSIDFGGVDGSRWSVILRRRIIQDGYSVYRMALSVTRSDQFDSNPVFFDYIHFEEWPDFGVPVARHYESLVSLIECVAQYPAAAVHCRAGVGRTGTFFTLLHLYLTHLFPTGRLNTPIDDMSLLAEETVLMLRRSRQNMVQNKGQWMFILSFFDYLVHRSA